MSYRGRELTSGNYLKLDDIQSQFNGSTTTFNLTSGGSAFYPGSAFSLLVSLAGVVQEAVSAYTINQNTITFASAPQASDDFFCIVLGIALGVGVPGDGTVSGEKLTEPFEYDDGLLYLDSVNDRVGINSTAPRAALDVRGGIIVSGGIDASGIITARTGITVSAGGINAVGVITATSFSGAGSGLTGVSTNFVSAIGIQSAGLALGVGITQLNFIGLGNTFSVNGTTIDISIAGGGGSGQGFATSNSGIHTSSSVGVNTTGLPSTLTGIGNSFQGIYVSNGMYIMDNTLTGNHYIGTNFNGLMAGPVTVNGALSIDGVWVVV